MNHEGWDWGEGGVGGGGRWEVHWLGTGHRSLVALDLFIVFVVVWSRFIPFRSNSVGSVWLVFESKLCYFCS